MALELAYSLLNTMLLANKGIEVFLKKKSCGSEIYFEEEISDFINIVDSPYIVTQTFLLVQIGKNTLLKWVKSQADVDHTL